MTKDFTRKMRCSNGLEVTVLYHYEYAYTEAVPVIDHVWNVSMETDVLLSSLEKEILMGKIIATYMSTDLKE